MQLNKIFIIQFIIFYIVINMVIGYDSSNCNIITQNQIQSGNNGYIFGQGQPNQIYSAQIFSINSTQRKDVDIISVKLNNYDGLGGGYLSVDLFSKSEATGNPNAKIGSYGSLAYNNLTSTFKWYNFSNFTYLTNSNINLSILFNGTQITTSAVSPEAGNGYPLGYVDVADSNLVWSQKLSADISFILYDCTNDDNYPNIVFLNQTPQDINITSFGVTNIFYNITDDVGISSAYLTYKVNNSVGIVSSFNNGTGYSMGLANATYTNQSNIYKGMINDNMIFPAVYNINESYNEQTAKNQLNLSGANAVASINFVENTIPNKKYYVAECYINNTVTTANTLKVYVSNSSYTTGNPNINPNVFLISTITPNQPYNHNHSNFSKHYIFPFTNSTIKNPSKIILKSSVSSEYRLNYVSDIVRTGSMQYSANNGATYTNIDGTADCHIHFFDGDETLCYYSGAVDTLGQRTESSYRCDTLDVTIQPPTPAIIFNPNSSSVVGSSFSINWTSGIPFYLASIKNYTLDLLYTSNLSVYANIVTLNNSFNSYTYSNPLIVSGNYTIRIITTDNYSNSALSYSDAFEVDNTLPSIIAYQPSGLFLNTSIVYANEQKQFLISFIDDNLFITSVVMYLPNGTLFQNETIIRYPTETSYDYNYLIAIPNITGNYTGFAYGADGGTNKDVKDKLKSRVTKISNQIINNECFTLEFINSVNSLNLDYLSDRVTFEALYKDKTYIKNIKITKKGCSGHITTDQIHNKHLVIGKYWIDFVSDGLSYVNIADSGSYYSVELGYLNAVDSIKYKSIGIINENRIDFEFRAINRPVAPVVGVTTENVLFLIFCALVMFGLMLMVIMIRIPALWFASGLITITIAIAMFGFLPSNFGTNYLISMSFCAVGVIELALPFVYRNR